MALPLPLSNVRGLRSLAVALLVFLALCLVWLLNSDHISERVAILAGQGYSQQQPASSNAASSTPPPPPRVSDTSSSNTHPVSDGTPLLRDIAQHYIDFPLNSRPYRNKYGELGRRTRILRDAIAHLESSSSSASSSSEKEDHLLLEQLATSLFPFLLNQPSNPNSTTPLSDLRSTIIPGSKGIIIPTGDRTIRFAAHLIAQLRRILGSTLPIQIVYAGDADLSPENRKELAAIPGDTHGPALEFLDIYSVFDDATLLFTSSASGGWAVKAFAALATHFEQVVVLDADAVFLQPPEVLLAHPAFERSGALLFHDRLLWQHRFQDRHSWWREEIRRPSAAMNKSRVWTEDYAEECDSGVVVLDKGRLEVLMGLLHTCWQNMFDVRDDCTYRITYGDKETWWMGQEMAGSTYEFSSHYGGIVGWEETHEDDGTKKVCSFVIAHVDTADRLLWYNGGLLKNKLKFDDAYEVPEKWMIDADWLKGGSKEAMSCIVNGTINDLTREEKGVLARSIEEAKEMDKKFHNVFHNKRGKD
ncbi:mannosyltransferase putative-domain-containing protein [Coniochaeta sp. 2T2.1]|nr:mannosyltransferase putative-domain-containing protein [Coniochaeta sp. 2T2.1]